MAERLIGPDDKRTDRGRPPSAALERPKRDDPAKRAVSGVQGGENWPHDYAGFACSCGLRPA